MDPITVVLVDDHKLVRDGIKALLIGEKRIKVIGEAEGSEGLFLLLNKLIPDVLLLDIQLVGKNGIDISIEINEKFPLLKILVLSSNTDEETIVNSVKAGVKGFLSKDTTKEELITAITLVHSNENYFGEKISKIVYKNYIEQVKRGSSNENHGLSERETEILVLLAEGMSIKDIAEKLFISPRTIDTHKANIMSKLNLSTTVDLVKFAIKHGFVKL